MARVSLQHLSKEFPARGGTVRAVEDLSLAIENGEWLVLVGPSGCGKTTTLRLVAGLEKPSRGTISIDGKSVEGVAPKDRDIAMVFQNPALYPHLAVFDNMAFGLTVRGIPRAELTQRVKSAAEMLGLAGCLERMPTELSGGERQRVALGRALVRRPAIFLFDEPLANLDPQTALQLRTDLLSLRGQFGATVLYVTHDQEEAMTLGQRIAVLRSGALQQVGNSREVYDRPANLFVATFIGSPPINVFRGTLRERAGRMLFENGSVAAEKQRLSFPLTNEQAARLAARSGRAILAGVRPETIDAGAERQGGLEAEVEFVEDLGPDQYVHAKAAGERLVIRLRSHQGLGPRARIRLHMDPAAVHFFDPETEAAI